MGRAEQVQVGLTLRYVGRIARREVLHRRAVFWNDRFEGCGSQHCFLYVLGETEIMSFR